MIKIEECIFFMLNELTLITFASFPSWFTSSVTISCKPVTILGYVTVLTALMHAILTIEA